MTDTLKSLGDLSRQEIKENQQAQTVKYDDISYLIISYVYDITYQRKIKINNVYFKGDTCVLNNVIFDYSQWQTSQLISIHKGGNQYIFNESITLGQLCNVIISLL